MDKKRGISLGLSILVVGLAAAYFLRSKIRPEVDDLNVGAISNNRELVEVGRKVFFGKGQCALCHTLSGEGRGKCPDLEGVGARLTREFLYETLTKPDAYIKLDFEEVEPKRFPARMPVINKPPIGLTEQELLSVISFVQSQGGKVTVSPTELGREQKGF